jgi:predicted RNA-binding protein YlxR (DUF448 family)
MTRGRSARDRDEPERRCIVTGETGPKNGLVRFVVGPGDVVVPDVLGKLPGRGMWVTARRAVLEKAGRGQFARSARQPVTVPDDLLAQVEAGLLRRVLDTLSLARKAGIAVAGFEKVKDWLDKGEAKVLLQAADGSGRGKDKLWTPTGGRFFGCLTASELGLAFGRERVIHAALAAGGLTTRLVEDAARLSGVREDGGGTATGKDD